MSMFPGELQGDQTQLEQEQIITELDEQCVDTDFDVIMAFSLDEAWKSEACQLESSASEQSIINQAQEKVATFYEGYLKEVGAGQNRSSRREADRRVSRMGVDAQLVLNGTRLVASDRITAEDAITWDSARSRESIPNEEIPKLELAQIFAEIIVDAYQTTRPIYQELYEHRRSGLGELYGYLSANPVEIGKFITWVEEYAVSPETGVKPLLTMLANDIHDSSGDNFAKTFWNRLKSGEIPLDLRSEFLSDSLTVEPSEVSTSERYTETIKFARKLFPGTDPEFIQSAIDNFESWPEELSNEYASFYRRILNLIEASIADGLQDSVRKGRFEPNDGRLVIPGNGGGRVEGNGNSKKRGGRVTARVNGKVAPEHAVEAEPKVALSGYGRILKTDRGYYFEECEKDKVISMLEGYSKANGSGRDLLDDLTRMLDSIFDVPYGEGASPYTSTKIRLGNNQSVSVWHLNPDRRPQLVLNTHNGRRSRISYCVVKNNDTGQQLLGVIGAEHHNNLEGAVHKRF